MAMATLRSASSLTSVLRRNSSSDASRSRDLIHTRFRSFVLEANRAVQRHRLERFAASQIKAAIAATRDSVNSETLALWTLRMVHLASLGADVKPLAPMLLELMHQTRIGHKALGYWAASMVLPQLYTLPMLASRDHPVDEETNRIGRVLVYLLRRDFAGEDEVEVALASKVLSAVATPDLAQTLLPLTVHLLGSSVPRIRKRAAVAMLSAYRRAPHEAAPHLRNIVVMIHDADPGVAAVALSILTELVRERRHMYRSFVPDLIAVLEQTDSNAVFTRVLKLLSLLLVPLPIHASRGDSSSRKELAHAAFQPTLQLIDTLLVIVEQCDSMQVMMQAVLTCCELRLILVNEQLHQLVADRILACATSADPNLAYLGLLAAAHMLKESRDQARPLLSPLAPQLEAAVLDPTTSVTMQWRSANVLVGLATSTNVLALVMRMIDLLDDHAAARQQLALFSLWQLARQFPDIVRSALDMVIPKLDSGDVRVRNTAADVMGQLVADPEQLVDAISRITMQRRRSTRQVDVMVDKVIAICRKDGYAYLPSAEWYKSVLIELLHVPGAQHEDAINEELERLEHHTGVLSQPHSPTPGGRPRSLAIPPGEHRPYSPLHSPPAVSPVQQRARGVSGHARHASLPVDAPTTSTAATSGNARVSSLGNRRAAPELSVQLACDRPTSASPTFVSASSLRRSAAMSTGGQSSSRRRRPASTIASAGGSSSRSGVFIPASALASAGGSSSQSTMQPASSRVSASGSSRRSGAMVPASSRASAGGGSSCARSPAPETASSRASAGKRSHSGDRRASPAPSTRCVALGVEPEDEHEEEHDTDAEHHQAASSSVTPLVAVDAAATASVLSLNVDGLDTSFAFLAGGSEIGSGDGIVPNIADQDFSGAEERAAASHAAGDAVRNDEVSVALDFPTIRMDGEQLQDLLANLEG